MKKLILLSILIFAGCTSDVQDYEYMFYDKVAGKYFQSRATGDIVKYSEMFIEGFNEIYETTAESPFEKRMSSNCNISLGYDRSAYPLDITIYNLKEHSSDKVNFTLQVDCEMYDNLDITLNTPSEAYIYAFNSYYGISPCNSDFDTFEVLARIDSENPLSIQLTEFKPLLNNSTDDLTEISTDDLLSITTEWGCPATGF